MTWIILQFVFLAMPVVLPALLYRSRRYFMAKFYDKMIWSEKARRLYTHVLLIVLLLFHYVYTSGHPGEFGVVPSPLCVPHGPLSGGRTDGCAVCSTGRTFRLVCALGIGHRLRAASVHDVRNHRLYSFGCPVLPVGKGHVRKDRHAQIPRMAGISRSISRQLS